VLLVAVVIHKQALLLLQVKKVDQGAMELQQQLQDHQLHMLVEAVDQYKVVLQLMLVKVVPVVVQLDNVVQEQPPQELLILVAEAVVLMMEQVVPVDQGLL
jgi:hypothetical protein